jgi:hypothetical protein
MGDVDRKKHDVDVIERVLGGAGADDGPDDRSTPLLDVEVPWFGGVKSSTVELTVGLPEESRSRSDRDRDRERD